jgi:hypothetical protein
MVLNSLQAIGRTGSGEGLQHPLGLDKLLLQLLDLQLLQLRPEAHAQGGERRLLLAPPGTTAATKPFHFTRFNACLPCQLL